LTASAREPHIALQRGLGGRRGRAAVTGTIQENAMSPSTLIYRKQRRARRVDGNLPVRYGIGALDRSDRARNISVAGLYVATNDVLGVGTRIRLAVGLPDGESAMRGEVVWAIQVPPHLVDSMVFGMGIRLFDCEPSWPARFERWKRSQQAGEDHSPK